MLRRLTIIIITLTLTAVVLLNGQITSSTTIYPHYTTGQDSIIQPGDEFWVDIKVANVTGLFGTSFELNHHASYVSVFSADSVVKGDFLGTDLVFTGTVGSGKVSIGVSQKSGATGADGSGTVARVKFVASGSTPVLSALQFTLTNVVSTDAGGSDITLNTMDYYMWVAGITVWPGDANNDNTVDQTDILPLGTYWNNTGTARSGASRTWTAQEAAPWTPEAATYADCDGTGIVDQADIFPIGLNWGNSHTLLASVAYYPELPGAMLDARLVPHEEDGSSVLTLSLGADYDASFRGLSFAVSASGDVEILGIEKGSSWSERAIFYAREDNGVWGVAITELGEKILDGLSGRELVRILYKDNSTGKNSAPVNIDNLRASLTSGEIVGVIDPTEDLFSHAAGGPSLPRSFSLSQNSPNPFNPSTTISYSIPDGQAVNVSLKVFDIRGRMVRNLAEGTREPGSYSIQWDGRDTAGRNAASGVYFYRLEAGDFVSTRKMVLVK